MPSQIENIDTVDAPIREILGKVPSWILRWGNYLLLFFFLSLVLIATIFKYPETINTKITIQSINGPKPIIPLSSGKVVKLFQVENLALKKGDIIAYIESNGKHDQVLDLLNMLDSIRGFLNSGNARSISTYITPRYHELGELQQPYQTFLQSLLQFRNYLSDGFYLKKQDLLMINLEKMRKLKNLLDEERKNQEQDLSLSQKTFDTNKELKNENVISEFDLRAEQSKLIGKTNSLSEINAAIVNNEVTANEKQQEIFELKNSIGQQHVIFQEDLYLFRSQIEDWIKKFIIRAPIDGILSFTSFLQENQQLRAGQTIGFVTPPNSAYYAVTYIPQNNFGKIAIGQKVILKLPSYPYQEYGALYGSLAYVSNIFSDSSGGYLAKILFPDGLTTTSKKRIQYNDGLMADGEIITSDLSLLQRFYYNVVKLAKK